MKYILLIIPVIFCFGSAEAANCRWRCSEKAGSYANETACMAACSGTETRSDTQTTSTGYQKRTCSVQFSGTCDQIMTNPPCGLV